MTVNARRFTAIVGLGLQIATAISILVLIGSGTA
jgi:hypothetical protein